MYSSSWVLCDYMLEVFKFLLTSIFFFFLFLWSRAPVKYDRGCCCCCTYDLLLSFMVDRSDCCRGVLVLFTILLSVFYFCFCLCFLLMDLDPC